MKSTKRLPLWSDEWSPVVSDSSVLVMLPLAQNKPSLLVQADYCEDPARQFVCAVAMAQEVADYLSGRTCIPKWLGDFERQGLSLVSLPGALIRAVGPLVLTEKGRRTDRSQRARIDRVTLIAALLNSPA